MESAAKRLQHALSKVDRKAFVRASIIVGMSGRDVGRAFRGAPVPVLAYMRLCALVGIDAATGRRPGRMYPHGVSWSWLAMDFRRWRLINKKSLSAAASMSCVGTSTLSLVGLGGPVNTESYVAVCALIGKHPGDFMLLTRAEVSRETDRRQLVRECQSEARS
jgi:hypothetical protein